LNADESSEQSLTEATTVDPIATSTQATMVVPTAMATTQAMITTTQAMTTSGPSIADESNTSFIYCGAGKHCPMVHKRLDAGC
jgi:hypothetical protein